MRVDSLFVAAKNGHLTRGCELASVNGISVPNAFASEPASWWPRTSTIHLGLVCGEAAFTTSIESQNLSAHLGEFGRSAFGAYEFGMRVNESGSEISVIQVATDSPAAEVGVRAGMRIREVTFLRPSPLSISSIDRLNQPYDRSGVNLLVADGSLLRVLTLSPVQLPEFLRRSLGTLWRAPNTSKGRSDAGRVTD
jgi:hypothetical protein